MKGFVFLTFFSLLLFASTIESRPQPGDQHWRNLIKDEPLSETVKDLLTHSEKKMDCDETLKPEDREKLFVKDIEPRPQATFYPNDIKMKEFATNNEKLFVKDIEPRPQATFYPNDIKTRESATNEKLSVKDIEPRPQATFYPNEIKMKESANNENPFAEAFEPRPNLSIYNN